MLVEFKTSNFLSFKEETTFSLVASSLKDNKINNESVMFSPSKAVKYKLLKTGLIYGANASGKSNFLTGISFFKNFIIYSSNTQIGDEIRVSNFKLSEETENKPSFFEIIFIKNETEYRYGFNVSSTQVESEWLYTKHLKVKAKPIEIFFRNGNKYETIHSTFIIGKDIVNKKMVRTNALLLTVAAQFNDTIATDILKWLFNFNVVSGLQNSEYSGYTIQKLNDPEYKKRIIDFTKFADLGIDDIQQRNIVEEKNFTINNKKESDLLTASHLLSLHQKFDKNMNESGFVEFNFKESESHGTQKYFSLAGPILDTLDKGKILLIDELDSKLHPLLTEKIISLFNSPETNPKNAQLIFTTHDTNLLSANIFRRDQIWFTEKDRYGASTLFSLSDINKVRNDSSFEKDYLAGKYGAIPSFNNFNKLFSSNIK